MQKAFLSRLEESKYFQLGLGDVDLLLFYLKPDKKEKLDKNLVLQVFRFGTELYLRWLWLNKEPFEPYKTGLEAKYATKEEVFDELSKYPYIIEDIIDIFPWLFDDSIPYMIEIDIEIVL